MTAAAKHKIAVDKPKATFVEVFQKRVKKIERDALRVGLNFTVICKQAGISRATPDRWKKSTPKTILLIAKLESIIEEAREKQEKGAARTH